MARKLFIAGNWKMNTNKAEAVELAKAVAESLGSADDVDIAVCPPACYISDVCQAVAGSKVAVGAQNACSEDNGAFTGEISTDMINDLGCKYVILGHSERRHIFGETDEMINAKTAKVLAAGLLPIVCVGELLEEREAGKTTDVVATQTKAALAGVSSDDAKKITIAYEPVWAIGTGKVATVEQAQEVHAMIRGLLTELYGADIAGVIRIQYGGSVKPDNAGALLGCEDIDGALVGGAALKADSFAGIVEATR